MKPDDTFLLFINKGYVLGLSYMIENIVEVPVILFNPSCISRSSISKRTIVSGRAPNKKKQGEKNYT
jgi:hypothetical protein